MTIDTLLKTTVFIIDRGISRNANFIGKYRELIEDNREVSGRAFGEKEL